MNTNIIVSFASFSLYKVTEIVFNFQDSNLGLFVFFSTLLAYNYMRLPLFNDCNKVDVMLQETYGNKNTIYYICIFLAMIICYLISELGFKFFKLITPAIIVSLLYPISFNLSSKEYSIRKIPFFKIFLIAFIWSYITLFVPLLYYNFDINYIFLDFFFQRLLFVLAICIPFDIRDHERDIIKTIPNTIGIYESKIFAWFCLFLIDILLIIDLINNLISIPFFIACFVCIEICSVVIYYTNNNRSLMFYGILVESLSIIMCLFVLVASVFKV